MNSESKKRRGNKSGNKVRMNLLLDDSTIKVIREYGETVFGNPSISATVRAMAKEYERKKQNGEW